MCKFLPTVNVSASLGAPFALPVALDPAIDAVTFRPRNADQPMSWAASLKKNYSDGILILHRGRVLYGRYFATLIPTNQQAMMSLTKSITGYRPAGHVSPTLRSGTTEPTPVVDKAPVSVRPAN